MEQPEGKQQQQQQQEQFENGSTIQHQQQLQHLYHQQHFHFDVRMKRHPELQPYVPSDRYSAFNTTTTRSPFGGSSSLSGKATNQHVGRANVSNSIKCKTGGINKITNDNSFKSSSSLTKQPKKYVSMSRLDQLAQPKKVISRNNQQTTSSAVPPSSLTSSNATSTTTSSLTSNKNYNFSTTRSSTGGLTQVRRQSGTSLKGKQDVSSISNKSTSKESTKQQTRRQPEQQKQQRQQVPPKPISPKQSPPKPISPKQSPRQSLKESTPIRPTETSQSGSSSRSISPIKVVNKTLDRPPQTPAPLVMNSDRQQLNESSVAEQMSEMSMNDRFYQSAASELVPDSENNSTNSINYDRNPESLCRELEQDLIAKGIVKNNDSNGAHVDGNDNDGEDDYDDEDENTPKATGNKDPFRRESVPTTDQQLNTPKLSKEDAEKPKFRAEEKEKRIREEEEEEKRLKIEEELRERARLEDEERKKRDELVESILSKFSQSPCEKQRQ